MNDQTLVTVCDACLTASCWKGIFMCWESDWAGTVDLPIEKLRELSLEHSDYYDGTYERNYEEKRRNRESKQ